jgi:hypothetical protein
MFLVALKICYNIIMHKKIIYSLKILIVLLIIALTTLVYFHQGDFTSVDLGRHLKNGQIIFTEPDILFKNVYSYIDADFPFINHHWLSGVIFWLLYLIGSFKILTLLNILLGVLTVLIIFKLTVKKSNFWLASLLMLPVILLLSERVDIRPEMFSYLFIAVTYYLLEDFRLTKATKKLIWFVPMFLIWVNLHIYFFIGLILIGLALAEQLILNFRNFNKIEFLKKFFYIFLACVIASLFNPNLLKGLIYPFNILKKYGYDIVENKSPFYLENLTINYNILIFKILLISLLISYILYVIIKKKINIYNLILVSGFTVFACLYIRNLPIFGLIVLPVIAQNLVVIINYPKLESVKYQVMFMFVAFTVYGLTLGLLIGDNLSVNKFFNKNLGLGMNAGSLESVKFYKNNNLTGPIFNNYDLGSALIFWLYPKEKIFVDNRPEAYKTESFNQVYIPMQNDVKKWQVYSEKYKINLIYFSHTDGTPWAREFLANKLHDATWPLIYFDNYTVIMVKDNSDNQPLILKYKIDETGFSLRIKELLKTANENEKIYLANLAVNYGRPDLAENIFQSILSIWPKDGKILAALGFLYSGGDKVETITKSLEYFNKAINNDYKLPALYNQMGLNYWKLLDYNEAKNMWRKALQLDSANETAKNYLKQAAELIK